MPYDRIVALMDQYAVESDRDKKAAIVEQLCEILFDQNKLHKAERAEAAD
jgi:hypothetical protein